MKTRLNHRFWYISIVVRYKNINVKHNFEGKKWANFRSVKFVEKLVYFVQTFDKLKKKVNHENKQIIAWLSPYPKSPICACYNLAISLNSLMSCVM